MKPYISPNKAYYQHREASLEVYRPPKLIPTYQSKEHSKLMYILPKVGSQLGPDNTIMGQIQSQKAALNFERDRQSQYESLRSQVLSKKEFKGRLHPQR